MTTRSPARPQRRTFGAWIRYGTPVTDQQLEFAADHYAVAVLQPWETAAASWLKRERPDMTVLAYKCLSSTRSYEPGPVFSSGVGFAEAAAAGEHLFAHRRDGRRIEWDRYSGHWQMAVWEPEYRERWTANVVAEVRGSAWDGVMADNDVFDDYYGLDLPITDADAMSDVRAALDLLVEQAGSALNAADKILVPNIAESRREPGRWRRHSSWGGGFDEVWLAHTPDHCFDADTILAQAEQARGPGVCIMRTATDGRSDHPHVLFGLAALWIFGGGRGTAFSGTAHDQYSGTPFVPEQGWDLGDPVGGTGSTGGVRTRLFQHGWAAIRLPSDDDAGARVPVPHGLVDAQGGPAPAAVTLRPGHGALFVAPERCTTHAPLRRTSSGP